jgi:CoA:oxalate CoA-transferase
MSTPSKISAANPSQAASKDPSRSEALLAGFKICDFTRVLSGPYCTRLLADLGADVIKIERPGEGDEVRYITPQMDPNATDQSAYFARTNAGKRSVAIDFANPGAREVVLDLVRQADVVVENFSPGVMAKYKFDYESLRAIKPDLVYCSISGFGQTGPLRSLQAYAHLINAFSGMMDLERGGTFAPRASNLQAADVLAGAHAFGVICAALLRRAKRGQGAYLDVSMLECLVCADDVNFASLLNDAPAERRPRIGMVVQPIADRFVALQVGGAANMWSRLVGAMNRPDLANDTRFTTSAGRRANWTALLAILDTWLKEFKSVDEAVEVLGGARVPSVPMMLPEEIIAHPHMAYRQAFPTLTHPSRAQGVRITAPPFHLDGKAIQPPVTAPWRIGEHTIEVLKDVLGYSPERIESLRNQKVVALPVA